MRVSVRLKGLWATALVASLTVAQAPSMAQSEKQFDPAAAGQAQPATAALSQSPVASNTAATDSADVAEAKRLLLKARQALAMNDLTTAQSMAEAAGKLNVDFQMLGDSPATVTGLVERLNELIAMKEKSDPGYNAGAASYFLVQAEALLYYGDLELAEGLIGQARMFPVEFDQTTGDPDQLEKLIAERRAQASPQMDAKAEALKLLAQAQLAFDRGQYNDAMAFVSDAKQLDVAASEFSADEPQPWKLEMEIQKALNQVQFDANVAPTASMASQESENQVSQAAYDPASDTTRNVAVSNEDDLDTGFSPAQKLPASGVEMYRAGISALQAGRSDEARNYLTRAWEMREELDPVTQQSVQDQLSKLTMQDKTIRLASQWQEQEAGNIEEADSEVFRALQKEVFSDRAAAERLLQDSPREALEKFAMIHGRISQSQIDARRQRYLLQMIERDMDKVQEYIDLNLSTIENAEINDKRRDDLDLRRQRRMDVEQQMQSLVERYNKLIDEQRFHEAELIARQAYDLDPQSEIAVLLKEKAMMARRVAMNENLADEKERRFWLSMLRVVESSRSIDTNSPVEFDDPEAFARKAQIRTERLKANEYDSESDRLIWTALKSERVQGDYRGTLAEAVDQLSRQTGINILFDEVALNADNVRTDSTVSLSLHSPISFESALKTLIGQHGLVFVVENEVIRVTSKEARQLNTKTETYYIGDLVMPMAAPQNPYQMEFIQPRMLPSMGGSMNVQNASTPQVGNQLAMAQQLGGLAPNNPFGGGANPNNYRNDYGPQMGQPTYATVGQQPLGGVTLQDFQPLIQLIQNTIATDSWQDTGQGLGTIQPYLANLSLVVSNTQEVQDEIQDLLSKLRELNDVQIVVEVRFVTLQDNFFERVGIDFDFNINDSSGITNPTADTQPTSGVVGRQPIESTPFTPTNDLDIQFLQGNFNAAEPLFGGFSAASAASIGFAILSDIEVFFLLQASKGNTRTNITQAPTVTMFNGQSANVNDSAQRPFVTSVVPVVGDFAVAHQPIITILPDGTNLNVTAVVSADRKYVRLQLVPFFSQVVEVNTFTFDGSQRIERSTNSILDDLLDIVDGGANADDTDDELQTVTQGITVQLPVLATTTVSTVVSVPDGGTVLMGGIKRMREGRNESGVPFLSNIPYVNRLFKNVGIGHETQHLMMMVTPRIIIQQEIEDELVGSSN